MMNSRPRPIGPLTRRRQPLYSALLGSGKTPLPLGAGMKKARRSGLKYLTFFGGANRNRTDVHGFAGRRIPSIREGFRAIATPFATFGYRLAPLFSAFCQCFEQAHTAYHIDLKRGQRRSTPRDAISPPQTLAATHTCLIGFLHGGAGHPADAPIGRVNRAPCPDRTQMMAVASLLRFHP